MAPSDPHTPPPTEQHAIAPLGPQMFLAPTQGSFPPAFFGQYPSQPATPAPEPPPSVWVKTARKYWLLLGIVTVASAAVAFLAAGRFAVPVWRAEGKLKYSPAPPPAALRGVYTPAGLATYSEMVKSRQNLEALADEFELPRTETVKKLDKDVAVWKVSGSELISVALDWKKDREQGVEIVNRLMEMHVRDAVALRRETINRIGLEAARQAKTANLDERRKWSEYMAAYHARLKANPKGATEALDETTLDADTISRKKQLLDGIREEEAKISGAKAKRQTAQEQLDKWAALIRQRAISEAEASKLRSEVFLANNEIATAEDGIRRRTQELRALPTEKASQKIMELESQLDAIERQIKAYESPTVKPGAVEESDIQILTRATPTDTPVSSNKKTLLAGGTVAPVLLVFLLLAYRAFRAEAAAAADQPAAPATPAVYVEPPKSPPPANATTLLMVRMDHWIKEGDGNSGRMTIPSGPQVIVDTPPPTSFPTFSEKVQPPRHPRPAVVVEESLEDRMRRLLRGEG